MARNHLEIPFCVARASCPWNSRLPENLAAHIPPLPFASPLGDRYNARIMTPQQFIAKWQRVTLSESQRLVPKDADCAARLAKRTLTKLYNDRPAWLDLAHKKLDAAVFAAYGWGPGMSDDELLEKLLALNLERATK